jgi:large subunit ribosomal protein L6
MSRVGRKPIPLPKGVTVQMAGDVVTVKGPKGQLQMTVHPAVKVAAEGNDLVCTRVDESRESRAAHGLVRANTANMVKGVSEGFQRRLEINGVGYRAEVSGGKKLVLQLGYSHPIEYPLPEGISAAVEKNQIVLSGIDKQALGAAAANVRDFRPPEPYKGKGIKYAEETILRKAGKAAG